MHTGLHLAPASCPLPATCDDSEGMIKPHLSIWRPHHACLSGLRVLHMCWYDTVASHRNGVRGKRVHEGQVISLAGALDCCSSSYAQCVWHLLSDNQVFPLSHDCSWWRGACFLTTVVFPFSGYCSRAIPPGGGGVGVCLRHCGRRACYFRSRSMHSQLSCATLLLRRWLQA